MNIGLIPLDKRPVNTRYPAMIAEIAEAHIVLPPAEILSAWRRPADSAALAEWLQGMVPTLDGLIVSCEMFGYGSLIAARTSHEPGSAILAGEISRAELARLTRLTRTTVSAVVSDLMEQGLVEEVGQGPAAVGRTPKLLSVVDDSRHMVAVSITNAELHGAVVNLRGAILRRARRPLPSQNGDVVLDQLDQLLAGLVQFAGSPLLGIGLSTPGLIDTTSGIVRRAVNFEWQDLPLRSLLQSRYHVPIYIANDSHTVVLAEYMFGRSQDTTNLVAIKVGRGIGAGIVLNGQLFYGDGYGAGEIGHVVVVEEGQLCKCGNYGCLETVANIPAIICHAQSLAQNDPRSPLHRFAPDVAALDLDAVLQALLAGDPAVRQIIVDVGRYLGIAVANLVGMLSIRRIVITGQIAPFGQVLRDAILHEVRRRVLPALAQVTEIDVLAQGADTILLGAAALLLINELGLGRLLRRESRLEEAVA